MSLPSEVDIAIIGAGAAGLGAARTLENSGLNILVLEARHRVGGRAHTVIAAEDVTFDAGCGWLHSADKNSFVPVAQKLRFEIDPKRPRWRDQSLNIGFPERDRANFIKELDAFWDRADAAAKLPQDAPASSVLEAGSRWNPLFNALSSYISGVELDRVSVKDFATYQDSELNWRIKRGYGALVAAYGATVPVALNTIVSLIDHSSTPIRIATSQGRLTAGKVIVTVPTDILAKERIRFVPELPDKVAAAAGLPLGLADKVTLGLDRPDDLPIDGHMRGAIDRSATGSYQLRPFGQPCIEGYFGGSFARALEEAGDGALGAAAVDEVVALLGSDYRKKLRPLASSRWALDEFALGSYSCALPGHASDRAILATPVDHRLFFAGEATHPFYFSTCHGARDSGERAAKEAMGVAVPTASPAPAT
jgi:monoamine oxidase